jgi:hypothetical protein
MVRALTLAAGIAMIAIPAHRMFAVASTPYSGTPLPIPGQINAELFDNGGEGVAYYDTTPGNSGGQARATDVDIEDSSEGGYDIGWIAAGEWLNYTVTAQSAGSYSVQLRVASPGGASMHVGFNGPSNVWSVVAIPATGGWQTWTTVTLPVTLGAGTQQMTLRFDTGGMNLHDTTVTSTGVTSLPTPWSSQDIGATGLTGSASFASGDAQIVARVANLQNVNAYAKAGVMLRSALAAGSAHVLLDVRPNGSIEFISRAATGAATTFIAGEAQPPPASLSLTRSGTTFAGGRSPDAASSTLVGSTNVALAAKAPEDLTTSSPNLAVPPQKTIGSSPNEGILALPPSNTLISSSPNEGILRLAPAAPGLPAPVDTAIGVGLSTSLTWTAAGAASYQVRFGTTNPPAAAVTGLTTAVFVPPALTTGMTYYWQVVAGNAGGSTTGPVWSFTVIVAPPGAPALYSAIADRTPYTKPALPQLGAAGFTFNDPLFGSKILRVTDGNTRPGLVNRSFRVASNAHLAAWNAASTAFYVESNDGTIIPYTFNPATMTAARIQPTGADNGGFTLSFYVEPQFSILNPNLIYGVTGSNNRTIEQFDFSTGAYTTILDLDTLVSGLANTYVGGLNSGGTPETLLAFFGGAAQDAHYYALFAPLANPGGGQLLNTLTSTINGHPTSTVLNFHLHSVSMDKGGRYVFLYPTGVDLAAPRLAAQVYLWDTASGAITAITADMHPGGHGASEYGYWVNQDCCTSSAWDAAQWQFRSLTAVAQTSDLISPILTPKEVYLADHTTWNNAQPATLVPVISATYRYGDNTAPWRAWDDEIIGIQTAGGIGGIVWRFAHHRSLVASDTVPTTPYFWYEPIANVSPDGKWVLFTSNWEKTLGQDSSNDSSGAGTFRQDVFVVQLTPQP